MKTIERFGLNKLYAPEDESKATVEYDLARVKDAPAFVLITWLHSIVFIHGPFGHPQHTWTFDARTPSRNTSMQGLNWTDILPEQVALIRAPGCPDYFQRESP